MSIKRSPKNILIKGFTLIEMIVVVAVMSLLMVASIEIFSNMYSLSVRNNDSRIVQQDVRYALETISREARNSKELIPISITDTYYIDLKNQQEQSVRFACVNCNNSSTNGRITMSVTNPDGTTGPLTYLTSDKIEVTQFYISPIEIASETAGLNRGGEHFPFFTLRIMARGKSLDRSGNKTIVTLATSVTRDPYSEYTYCEIFGCGEIKMSSDVYINMAIDSNGILSVITGSVLNRNSGFGGTVSTWTKMPAGSFGGKKVIDVEVGGDGSYVIDSENKVWVVGRVAFGALGIGDLDLVGANCAVSEFRDSWVPGLNTSELQLSNIIQVSAGDNHAHALDSNGIVYATGSGYRGETGIGSTSNTCLWTPISSPPWGSARIVKLGHSTSARSSFAIDNQGRLWATGSNAYNGAYVPRYGNLGIGSEAFKVLSFTSSMTGSLSGRSVNQVSAGSLISYAVDSIGNLHAVGNNVNGDLGIPSIPVGQANYRTSWQNTGVTGVAKALIRAGAGGFALKSNGEVWGTSGNSWVKINDPLLVDIVDITVGNGRTMALKRDGTLIGIGGELGGAWNVQPIRLN